MKRYRALCLLVIVLIAVGCGSGRKKDIQPAAPADSAPAVEAASLSPKAAEGKKPTLRVEQLQLPEFKREAPEKVLPPPVEPIDPKKVVHAEGPVTINAENMPLSDFILYALGSSLKVTFFMDEQVKNMKEPVTFMMSLELPPDKVFESVLGFLERKGLVVEEKAGSLYILKTSLVQKKPMDVRVGRTVAESPASIIQIIHMKHSSAAELIGLITDIYKASVTIKVHYKENALILSGPASSIKEVLEFIELLDVPYMREKKLFLVQLTYWQTDEFIKQMSTILQGLGFSVASGPTFPGTIFIPIKYLNSILVVSPDENTMKAVLDWARRLDTPESAGAEEKSFTFSPKYSKASELVDSIKKLYGVMPAQAQQKGIQAAVPVPASPSAIPGLKLSSDDRRNMVIVIATPSVYNSILSILSELDRPPKQVLIETTIAELTLKDDLKYGLEWYVKNRLADGPYTLQTLGSLGVSTGSGLAFQFLSDSQKFQAVINAFARENKINILSSPRLMVIDNEEATLQVGTDIPILSGETKTTASDTATSTVAVQSIQYRSTGLTLKVKPTINTEGMLSLTINIESSEGQTNDLSSIDSPLILTRRLNTSVIAASGQSILLGGIMSENLSDAESKVPIIGDIPLIGNFFKNVSKSKTKTELIIMMTPVILTNPGEAVRLTDELKKGLKWMR